MEARIGGRGGWEGGREGCDGNYEVGAYCRPMEVCVCVKKKKKKKYVYLT